MNSVATFIRLLRAILKSLDLILNFLDLSLQFPEFFAFLLFSLITYLITSGCGILHNPTFPRFSRRFCFFIFLFIFLSVFCYFWISIFFFFYERSIG